MGRRLKGAGGVFYSPSRDRWICEVSTGSPPNRKTVRRISRTREDAEAKLVELGGGASYEDLFWMRVEKTDGCWIWRGNLHKGYGWFYGRFAHRVSLALDGREPGPLETLHSCDNPPCVNPAHLRAGTHAENMREKALRPKALRAA